MKLITNKEAAENMLTNAKNTVTIYETQIAFYESVAETKTDEVERAQWLVERDKIKGQMDSMVESVSYMEPFVATYN